MDDDRTREQLIDELVELRRQVDELREANAGGRRTDDALRLSEATMSAAIESLPFDFFVVGEDGRYVMQNAVCRVNWGDLVGKRPLDLAPDDELRALWRENNRRAFAGETVDAEVEYNVDGNRRFLRNIISPIRVGETIRGILGVNIDVTDRRLAEEALQHRVEEITALNDLGRRVSASLSIDAAVQAGLAGITNTVAPDLALVFLVRGA